MLLVTRAPLFPMPKDARPLNFGEKTFPNSYKTSKFAEVFSLVSFPLYDMYSTLYASGENVMHLLRYPYLGLLHVRWPVLVLLWSWGWVFSNIAPWQCQTQPLNVVIVLNVLIWKSCVGVEGTPYIDICVCATEWSDKLRCYIHYATICSSVRI